jgi:N-acetylglucosamine transport system substrate-binding protein
MWYNRTMFAEHGWQKPRTWDELYALGDRIKKEGNGVAPFAFQGRYTDYVFPLVDAPYYQLAGRDAWFAQRWDLKPDRSTIPTTSSRWAWRSAWRATTSSPAFQGMSHTDSQLEFFTGKTAMIPCWVMAEKRDEGQDPRRLQARVFPIAHRRQSRRQPCGRRPRCAVRNVELLLRHEQEQASRARARNTCVS